MFNILVTASLRNRLFVLAAALLLVVYGIFTLPRIPVDVFPDLNRPVVTLITEAEGLAPQEVEQLVTFPIESIMNGMPGVSACVGLRHRPVDRLCRSSTGAPTSIAIVSSSRNGWRWCASSFRAAITRRWGPITSIMGEIMLIALMGDGASAHGRARDRRFRAAAAAARVPGVAQVIPIGGEVRQYRFIPNPR